MGAVLDTWSGFTQYLQQILVIDERNQARRSKNPHAEVTIFEDQALERNTVIAPASAMESGGMGVPASLVLMMVDAAPCASA